jgi:23S rRNA pseudouridine1911/1915/1917 synthase
VSTDVPQPGQVCVNSEVSLVGTQTIVTLRTFEAKMSDPDFGRAPHTRPPAITLTVGRPQPRTRLDRFVAEQLTQFSRSRVQQLIRQGAITVNGRPARASETVRSGDTIAVAEPPVEPIETRAEDIPLEIIFEDADLIVINKPPGLVVHPGAGHAEHTLVNALLHHSTALSGIGGKERPGIVHRLDKETSGCLVVAKNDAAHRGLSDQFAARTVSKVYLALVSGKLRQAAGLIEEKIGRHPVNRQKMSVDSSRGRVAKTDYRVLSAGIAMSLVECRLHSGRTHQIRVHLHHIGHPVVGDKIYGPKSSRNVGRQMLHAWKLGFRHPLGGEWKEFDAPVPDDFRTAALAAGLTLMAGDASRSGGLQSAG